MSSLILPIIVSVIGLQPGQNGPVVGDKPDLIPIFVTVVEADTKKPIPVFEYHYSATDAKGNTYGRWGNWQRVESSDGSFVLNLPSACTVSLGVRAAGFYFDTLTITKHEFTRNSTERKIIKAVARGETIKGIVLDASTKKPIPNARISPTIFTSPSFSPDHDRSVYTGEDGRFTIDGIGSFGHLMVEHPDYHRQDYYGRSPLSDEKPVDSGDATILLDSGDTLVGVVRDDRGKPVPGAAVCVGYVSRYLKTTTTAADGTFSIKGASKTWDRNTAYAIEIRTHGFMRFWNTFEEMPDGGFEFTLEPLFVIRGKVTSPSGQPIDDITVAAGPGKHPAVYESVSHRFPNAEFALGFDPKLTQIGREKLGDLHWVGIKADGWGVWEGRVPFKRDMKPMHVVLPPGVTVRGRIGTSNGYVKGGSAKLVPQRKRYDEVLVADAIATTFSTLTTAIDGEGRFRFDHVRSDNYTLHYDAAGASPRSLSVVVGNDDVELGEIVATSTGRIEGRVYRKDGSIWAFGRGNFRRRSSDPRAEIAVTSDDKGRFVVENVPAGNGYVAFEYTAGCFGMSEGREVIIEPGKTTNVVINNPKQSSDLEVAFIFGDGTDTQKASATGEASDRKAVGVNNRPPVFDIELTPTDDQPASLPPFDYGMFSKANSLNEGRIILRDAPRGGFRMRIHEWTGPRSDRSTVEPLVERNIDIKSDTKRIEVALPAGSITGQIKTSSYPAWGSVFAAPTNSNGRVGHSRCDTDGNFCVRFLPPGEYVLYAHMPYKKFQFGKSLIPGWCRLGTVMLDDDTRDIGVHEIKEGGTVQGTVNLESSRPSATALIVTDSRGIRLHALDFKGLNGERFTMGGLWPGEWSISLVADDVVIASAKASVSATETTTVTLSPSH